VGGFLGRPIRTYTFVMWISKGAFHEIACDILFIQRLAQFTCNTMSFLMHPYKSVRVCVVLYMLFIVWGPLRGKTSWDTFFFLKLVHLSFDGYINITRHFNIVLVSLCLIFIIEKYRSCRDDNCRITCLTFIVE